MLSLVYSSIGHFRIAQACTWPFLQRSQPPRVPSYETRTKWTGSTPRFFTIGRKIGFNKSRVPVLHKHACNEMNAQMINMMTWGLLLTPKWTQCSEEPYHRWFHTQNGTGHDENRMTPYRKRGLGNLPKAFPRHLFIDEPSNKICIHYSKCSCFARGEKSESDTYDQNDGEHQRPDAVLEGNENFLECRRILVFNRIVAFLGDGPRSTHQDETHQDSGNDTGKKELSYGNFSSHPNRMSPTPGGMVAVIRLLIAFTERHTLLSNRVQALQVLKFSFPCSIKHKQIPEIPP